jgi:hypothetical protein
MKCGDKFLYRTGRPNLASANRSPKPIVPHPAPDFDLFLAAEPFGSVSMAIGRLGQP